MPTTVRYNFRQYFPVAAQKAFDWCTDFGLDDHVLMGDKDAKRQVSRISSGTLILKDAFHLTAGSVEKQKLVQLYLGKLFWTSTHLTGPNKYSQFLYEIIPQGKDASTLKFTACHLEYNEKADAKLFAEQLCKEDASAWKLLAKAMEDDVKK